MILCICWLVCCCFCHKNEELFESHYFVKKIKKIQKLTNWIVYIYIYIYIYILFGYNHFTTGETPIGVTVVASLKLCTMQYKNIIDTLISTIIVNKSYCPLYYNNSCNKHYLKICSPLKCKDTSIVSYTIILHCTIVF